MRIQEILKCLSPFPHHKRFLEKSHTEKIKAFQVASSTKIKKEDEKFMKRIRHVNLL